MRKVQVADAMDLISMYSTGTQVGQSALKADFCASLSTDQRKLNNKKLQNIVMTYELSTIRGLSNRVFFN